MEQLWPTNAGDLSLCKFYRADNIADMVESRDQQVETTLADFLKHDKEQQRLSFLVNSDNFWNRFYYKNGFMLGYPPLPYILVNNGMPTSYRLPFSLIYLTSSVRHLPEHDSKASKGNIILFDETGQIEARFPDNRYLEISRRNGNSLDPIMLKKFDWNSPVILEAQYQSEGGLEYTLIQVFKDLAPESQVQAVAKFMAFINPKLFIEPIVDV